MCFLLSRHHSKYYEMKQIMKTDNSNFLQYKICCILHNGQKFHTKLSSISLQVFINIDHNKWFCLGSARPNIWYISDEGSDDNNCHTESIPCKNLQTVLNRAHKMYGDGADIYVTSRTLTLDLVISNKMSFTLSSINSQRSITVKRPNGWLTVEC